MILKFCFLFTAFVSFTSSATAQPLNPNTVSEIATALLKMTQDIPDNLIVYRKMEALTTNATSVIYDIGNHPPGLYGRFYWMITVLATNKNFFRIVYSDENAVELTAAVLSELIVKGGSGWEMTPVQDDGTIRVFHDGHQIITRYSVGKSTSITLGLYDSSVTVQQSTVVNRPNDANLGTTADGITIPYYCLVLGLAPIQQIATDMKEANTPQVWELKGKGFTQESYQYYSGVFKNGILQSGDKIFHGYGAFYDGKWSGNWGGEETNVSFIPEGTKDTIRGFFKDSNMTDFRPIDNYITSSVYWMQFAYRSYKEKKDKQERIQQYEYNVKIQEKIDYQKTHPKENTTSPRLKPGACLCCDGKGTKTTYTTTEYQRYRKDGSPAGIGTHYIEVTCSCCHGTGRANR